MDVDCPPSYEEFMIQLQSANRRNPSPNQSEQQAEPTIEENLPDGEKEYWTLLRNKFTIFDICCSITVVFGYILYLLCSNFDEVRMMDAKTLCNDPAYNHNDYKINNDGDVYPFLIIAVVFFMITVTTFLGFPWSFSEWKKILIKTLRKFWIVGIGYFFLYIFIYILKLIYGTPTPYFFSNELLYKYYCESADVMSENLEKLDRELRMSFPSYVMALECFSTAFMVFYVDHFDVGLGPHTLQIILLTGFGGKSLSDGIILYGNYEHHLADLLTGAIIGIAFAAYTVRNLKGTVLRNTSAMPKYINNGILFDTICRYLQNFCSFVCHCIPPRPTGQNMSYQCPHAARNYYFSDSTAASTQ